MKRIFGLLFFVAVFLMASCGAGSQKENNNADDNDTLTEEYGEQSLQSEPLPEDEGTEATVEEKEDVKQLQAQPYKDAEPVQELQARETPAEPEKVAEKDVSQE